VFEGAGRSRRDCGNLEAGRCLRRLRPVQGCRSRRDCGNLEAEPSNIPTTTNTAAAVAATAAILRRVYFETPYGQASLPQSPRLRQS